MTSDGNGAKRGLLERLADRDDVAVGLLTGNYREGARLKLGHYGIGHHFDFSIFVQGFLTNLDVIYYQYREVLVVKGFVALFL